MKPQVLAFALLLLAAFLPAQQPSPTQPAPPPVLPDATVDKLLKADAATREHALVLARQALDNLKKADAVLEKSQKETLQTTGTAVTRELAKGSGATGPESISDKGSQVLNENLQQRWLIGQQITGLAAAIAKLEAGSKPTK